MDFALLKAVSRSFYLSMVWLPPAMRRGIALGYMLARATDSVADTSTASPEKRVTVLRDMGRAIAGDLPTYELADLLRTLSGEMASAQSKSAESILLSRFGECLELLAVVSEQERMLIRRVLAAILDGQMWDLTYFAEHARVDDLLRLNRNRRNAQRKGNDGLIIHLIDDRLKKRKVLVGGRDGLFKKHGAAVFCVYESHFGM